MPTGRTSPPPTHTHTQTQTPAQEMKGHLASRAGWLVQTLDSWHLAAWVKLWLSGDIWLGQTLTASWHLAGPNSVGQLTSGWFKPSQLITGWFKLWLNNYVPLLCPITSWYSILLCPGTPMSWCFILLRLDTSSYFVMVIYPFTSWYCILLCPGTLFYYVLVILLCIVNTVVCADLSEVCQWGTRWQLRTHACSLKCIFCLMP